MDQVGKKEGFPYDLAIISNNCFRHNSNADNLRNGFVQDADIIYSFDQMCKRMKGKRSILMTNDEGEIKTFPVKSRWNPDYEYGRVVGAKALDQVKGLREVRHLILTISPDRIEALIPDWWAYGVHEFMGVVGGFIVSKFLRGLRAYKIKTGQPWNFITWVMEFHESGMVHFHLLFYGKWIEKPEVLHRWWPYSDLNGIRFGKPINHSYAGDQLARYLTKYITKDLLRLTAKTQKRIAAYLWFFGRRLYNMRHRVANSDGVYSLGIGREHYQPKVKWRAYSKAQTVDLTRFPYVQTEEPEPVIKWSKEDKLLFYADALLRGRAKSS
jgi:hypothetical protein